MTDKATYIAPVALTAKVLIIVPPTATPACIANAGVLFYIHSVNSTYRLKTKKL
jgi:hypothetical protein